MLNYHGLRSFVYGGEKIPEKRGVRQHNSSYSVSSRYTYISLVVVCQF